MKIPLIAWLNTWSGNIRTESYIIDEDGYSLDFQSYDLMQ